MLGMHPRCIELAKNGHALEERSSQVLLQAFTTGYVWSEHAAPDTNPNIRKPKRAPATTICDRQRVTMIGQRITVPQDAQMLRADRRLAIPSQTQAEQSANDDHRPALVGPTGETMAEP